MHSPGFALSARGKQPVGAQVGGSDSHWQATGRRLVTKRAPRRQSASSGHDDVLTARAPNPAPVQQGLVQRNLVQLWSQGRAVAPHVRPKQCHAPGVAARPERCRVTLNAMLGHLGVSLARWRVAPGTNDILSPTRHWPHRTPPRRACRHCLIASGTRPRNNRRQGPSAKPAKLRLTQKLWPPRGRFSAWIAASGGVALGRRRTTASRGGAEGEEPF